MPIFSNDDRFDNRAPNLPGDLTVEKKCINTNFQIITFQKRNLIYIFASDISNANNVLFTIYLPLQSS